MSLNTEQLKKTFWNDGYVVLRKVFDPRDLASFKTVILNTLLSVLERASQRFPALKNVLSTQDCNEALLALRAADPNYVSIVQRIISRSPEFFRLSSEPRVFNMIKALMDLDALDPLYLLSNGIVFTNPHDSDNKRSSNFELDWHQDTFFTLPRSRFFQFWGPVLGDSTTETGTLQVCPGSHKNGYGKQRIHPDLSFNHRFSMAPGEIDAYEHVSVEVPLGDLLIFHGQLIHASGHNISDQVRVSILGLAHDATNPACNPVSTHYLYHGQTPEAWFYEVFKDEKAKDIMYDQLAGEGEPIGGI